MKALTVLFCALTSIAIAWPGGAYPGSLVSAADSPITKVTTAGSLYLLQTLGYFSTLDDGDLRIQQTSVDLTLAIGGLRMLLAVFALAVAAGIASSKPAWERLFIAGSGLPIGLLCGVMRVTLGCVLLESVSEWLATQVLFDFAGCTTTVLAACSLAFEVWLLSRLLIAPPAREAVPVSREKKQAFERSCSRSIPISVENTRSSAICQRTTTSSTSGCLRGFLCYLTPMMGVSCPL
ncbi:MAG: archaeosortase/exosortase family protein [Planctomycetota bacterium]|nr:archaeosortase/exosortase family protein [Planctomycetota bacterium]MDA1164701.1 archaeosortase/exosortase family protein [Planctomycetota bacterium]